MEENRKENRQIKFRVSDLEFQKLEQAATSFGMSVPSFCKKKAQGVKMRPPKLDRAGAFEIAKELRAIGVNVNQLAKKANEGKNVSALDVQAVERQLNEIWQQFNSAIQK
ncbi:plasmid mobilization protein [Metabacillus idriensis]|uniref:plasmid mobilization protein n=1 Tax=Metabacillus idriensis TaxID=324768 RepID=UPI001CD405BF|nr:plasmid mobilization relaxosome protein MobC [Metabacillus idriensis]